MEKNRSINVNSAIIATYNLLLITFVIIALYFGREIFIPLVTAALLTFLFSPLVSYLELYLGRILSITIVVTLLFISAGIIGYTLYKQVINFSSELPRYNENIKSKFESLQNLSEKIRSSFTDTIEDLKTENTVILKNNEIKKGIVKEEKPIPVKIINEQFQLTDYYSIIFGSLFNFLGYTVLIMILLFFMLYYREDLNRRFLYVLGKGQLSATTRAIEDAGNRVSRYLMALFVVNIFYGISVTLALTLIGIPNAALWGIMGGVLRFIPYIGFIISALFPIFLSLVISADYFILFQTIGFYLGIELLVSYFIEPFVYGHRTGVSPLALIIAAIFWTWIWRAMGLVLAVPLTVCLVVIGRYMPRFETLSVLFGDKKALDIHIDLYYRIIAGDINDVMDFIDNFLKNHSLVALYDNMVIPMLTEVEKDYHTGSLVYKQKKWVFQTIKDINNELYSRPGDLIGIAPIYTSNKVVCIGASSARDDLASQILAQLLIKLQVHATYISIQDGLYGLTDKRSADIICISVVAPTPMLNARYMCSKLRKENIASEIIVGLWDQKNVKENDAENLKAAGANHIVTSMEAAISAIIAMPPSS